MMQYLAVEVLFGVCVIKGWLFIMAFLKSVFGDGVIIGKLACFGFVLFVLVGMDVVMFVKIDEIVEQAIEVRVILGCVVLVVKDQ